MSKLSTNSEGFSAVEFLLVIVTLAIIGVAGYFVAKHVDNKTPTPPKSSTSSSSSKIPTPKSGVYSFGSNNFPYLSSDFVLVSKEANGQYNSGIPQVNYTNTNSLSIVEAELINACKKNDYIPEGGFTYEEILNNGTTQAYGYAADCDNNQSKNLVWGFQISKSTKDNTFDISVTSQQTLP